MTKLNTQLNTSTEPEIDIAAEITSLRQANEKLVAQNSNLSDLNTRQQALLVGNPSPQRSQQQVAPDPNMSSQDKFMAALKNEFAKEREQTNQEIGHLAESMNHLMRNVVPDSPAWSRTDVAKKLMRDTPGISLDIALELADSRQVKDKAKQAAEQAAVAKLQIQKNAEQASMGNANSTSVNSPQVSEERGLAETMQANWDLVGMDAAVQQQEANLDAFDLQDEGIGIVPD